MSRAEMDRLGWDSCDIIIVTGDAYVDHPSFGMAVIGRVLEGQGFRVGIISQPDWRSADAFRALGKPNLFFGIAAGNMDSMINHYTADKKRRHDDAYNAPEPGYRLIDSSSVDQPGKVEPLLNPYEGMEPEVCETEASKSDADTSDASAVQVVSLLASSAPLRDVIRLPSFEAVKDDPVLYAHAARVMHKETNPHNAQALIQAHGDREVWFNPRPSR